MMDNLKTKYSYNEDDFVQNGEELKELTVTITLCEYRNLIRELSTYDAKIESVQEENKKIKEQLKSLAEIIVYRDPEIMNDIKKVIYSILGMKEEGVENDKMQKADDNNRV